MFEDRGKDSPTLEVPCERIVYSDGFVLKSLKAAEIEEMAVSIAESGVRKPLAVVAFGDKYKVVDGDVRLAAANLCVLQGKLRGGTVPIKVVDGLAVLERMGAVGPLSFDAPLAGAMAASVVPSIRLVTGHARLSAAMSLGMELEAMVPGEGRVKIGAREDGSVWASCRDGRQLKVDGFGR